MISAVFLVTIGLKTFSAAELIAIKVHSSSLAAAPFSVSDTISY